MVDYVPLRFLRAEEELERKRQRDEWVPENPKKKRKKSFKDFLEMENAKPKIRMPRKNVKKAIKSTAELIADNIQGTIRCVVASKGKKVEFEKVLETLLESGFAKDYLLVNENVLKKLTYKICKSANIILV